MKCTFLLCALYALMHFEARGQVYNYAPNTLNLPCIGQKGDVLLGVGWARGNPFQALEIQGAYSPAPHLAVAANYFGAREKNVRERTDLGTDFYLWEGAVGVYEKTAKSVASLYAGFGSGRLFSHYGLDRTAAFDINRWFLQPGLSYRNRYYQVGVALRLSRLDYRKGVVSYSIEPPFIGYIQNIEKNSPMFLPELGIQTGVRLKPVTIILSISSIFPDTEEWHFARLNSSLSAAVDFGRGKGKHE